MCKTLFKNLIVFILMVILTILMYESADHNFQTDSESLAVGAITAEILRLDIDKNAYGLGQLISLDDTEADVYSFMGTENHKGYEYIEYKSQIGLQGHVYKAIAHAFPRLNLYQSLRLGCCFFLIFVIFLICKQLYIKYGILFACVFGSTTFLSPWVVNFSCNLYWVEFTWFVPMLLGLVCVNYEKRRKYICPLFFIAILVKCLCGYEYISTIMMAGIMFPLVEWFCNKTQRKNLFRTVFAIGVFSLAGFVCAFAIHAYIYGDGNMFEGIKMLQVDLIERRTFGNAADFDPAYANSLNASVFKVLFSYFWSSGKPYDGKLVFFVAGVTSVLLMFQRIILKEKNNFEVSLFAISLLATVSWIVLGKAHSYMHVHMNFVLFYMGWFQSSIYIICSMAIKRTKGLQIGKENEISGI